MNLKYLALLSLAVSLVGCGSGGSGDSNNLGKGSNGGMLEGVWERGCSADEDNESSKSQVEYNGNKVAVNIYAFSDSSCGVSRFSAIYEGDFTLGNETVLSSGESVYRVTRSVTKMQVSYDTDEYIAIANRKKLCGYANWVKGILKDITNCSTFDISSDLNKDIVKVDGNNIFYGDTDYLDSDGYPTRLEADFYTKK